MKVRKVHGSICWLHRPEEGHLPRVAGPRSQECSVRYRDRVGYRLLLSELLLSLLLFAVDFALNTFAIRRVADRGQQRTNAFYKL